VNDDATLALLREHLQMAVPLFIFEFLDGRRQLRFPRPDLSQTVAQYGDQILYRGPHTAMAVNALCEGLASLAFCPGGVTAFDLHFEVPPEQQQDIDLHQLLSFVRDLSSAQPQLEVVAQLQMPLFDVEELLAASPGVALGGLYRDFISMVNGDESAYP
jgi:hypothetical protein